MKFYDILVNLYGTDLDKPLSSVPRYAVPAVEVVVLQAIHGAHAVGQIAEAAGAPDEITAREMKGTKASIRAWLQEKYGAALAGDQKDLVSVLGPEALALPTEIEGAAPAPRKSRAAKTIDAAPDLSEVVTVETIEGIE